MFFPVDSSISLIMSCLAGKFSFSTLIIFVSEVCTAALFQSERFFVISLISFVAFSNQAVISAYSGTACTILSFVHLDIAVDSLSLFAVSGVQTYRSCIRCFNISTPAGVLSFQLVRSSYIHSMFAILFGCVILD